MNDEIMVSVNCLVYNHAKYLRKCLDGFVMQKTNFKFEVLIHDDASTDGSQDIIREYEEKYPDIIKPIYQTENQYSQHISIKHTYQLPRAKGKYFAECEGDDYWCDENKLQMQFDYMEAHPDCTLCVHQVYTKNAKTGAVTLFSELEENGVIPTEYIMSKGGLFNTTSFFVRTNLQSKIPSLFQINRAGDISIVLYNTLCGYCYYFSKPMSVYNFGTEGSWTQRVYNDNNKRAENCLEIIALMKRVDEYTNFQYHESIQKRIIFSEFIYHVRKGHFLSVSKKKYRDCYDPSWNPVKEAISNRVKNTISFFKSKDK